MFRYRVKCNESESDIQNINLLYKIDQQCQNTFELLENKCKISKKTKTTSFNVLSYYM